MSLIKQSFIDKIYETADIVKVVSHLCSDLQKRGANYVCSSPFSEDKTPSFTVSPAKKIFKDFSSGKGGNVVNFVMEHQNLSFPEAIKWLADFYHLEVEYEKAEWAKKALERKNKREDLRPLLRSAQRQYQQLLLEQKPDHPAQLELQKRQYDDDVVAEWGIGYAPGHSFIYDKVKAIGQVSEAREIGLVGEKHDSYWERLTYPLHDANGLIIGFAGRDLSGKDKSAKWINPRESIVYDKHKTLYGLHKAKQEISRSREVYLVEGYNDVIAWHRYGLPNTVAPCGTAITERQIQILRKLADKVCFCLDGDDAGLRSAVKHIPIFIAAGFSTSVVRLPGCDPDDYVREFAKEIEAAKNGLADLIDNDEQKVNGFKVLLDEQLHKASAMDKNKVVQELAEMIAKIDDRITRELFTDWLAKESKVKASLVRQVVNEAQQNAYAQLQSAANDSDIYQLPTELKDKVSLQDLKPTIEKYGCFVAANRVYVKRGNEPPYSFGPVCNFAVSIIQHMNDEKFPSKLLRICNVHGKEVIFDTLSENLMTPQAFTNAMAANGNFLWKGGRQEHQQLLSLLFDQMGDGERIEVLGWQKAGFFVFVNRVVRPGQPSLEIDDNGVFKIPHEQGETCYYVPAANRVYRNNPYKYESQKRVVLRGNASLTFKAYAQKMKDVHRQHAITGILFAVASMFQDLVVSELNNFPLVFLYGPPSSGKDQLIECCQGFFGQPQTAINLEGGASTAKAQIRETAQFANIISHLSEYKRGDSKVDGMLKGMWDRRGYKRGNLESAVSSESIPVLSSVFLTGNDYPDNDALITRLVAEEMTQTEFGQEAKASYDELSDMRQQGVSHLTEQILQLRGLFAEKFKKKHRERLQELDALLALSSPPSRMLSNLAVLFCTYDILKDELAFPFTAPEIEAHFVKVVETQMRKLNSASIFNKFFDCFIAVCRTKSEPLQFGVDFNTKDGYVYFNLTNTYNRVANQWYRQYYENAPSKTSISDMLREATELDLQKVPAHRFDGGAHGHRTSAFGVLMKATGVEKELMEVIEWQEAHLKEVPKLKVPEDFINGEGEPPATPNDDPGGDEIPF